MIKLRRQFPTFLALVKWWRINVTAAGTAVFAAWLYNLPLIGHLDRVAYRLFWMLTAVLSITIWLNRRQLRGARFHLDVPSIVNCGEVAVAEIELHRLRGPLLSRLIVTLAPHESIHAVSPPSRAKRPGTPLRHEKRTRSDAAAPMISTSRCHDQIPFVATRRGAMFFPSIRVATDFPLGLFRWGTKYELRRELLVLPTYAKFPSDSLRDCLALSAGQFGFAALHRQRHLDDEYVGSRDYVDGMIDAKWDHRAWARLGRPVVRDFSTAGQPHVLVLIDAEMTAAHVPSLYANAEIGFEAFVSLSAALVDLLFDLAYVVTLVDCATLAKDLEFPPPCHRIEESLAQLSTLQPAHHCDWPSLQAILGDGVAKFDLVCIVASRWDAERAACYEAPTSAQTCIRFLWNEADLAALRPGALDFVPRHPVTTRQTEVIRCHDTRD